ncbi:hypothetical protein [Natrinema longum]|nr:hypothetical protein [Natrinema longum]
MLVDAPDALEAVFEFQHEPAGDGGERLASYRTGVVLFRATV